MSLYNMLFGTTGATFLILPMLGKHPDEYPRFRDCFLKDPDYPEYNGYIHVYTRVGGGNREDYQTEIQELRNMEGYVTDHDDSFDCTYATFVFKVPEKWKSDFEKCMAQKVDEFSEAYKQHLLKTFPKLEEQLKKILYKAIKVEGK